MKFYRLKILVLLIFALSCSSKKNSLGLDDEIRVVCSELDEPLVRKYLSSVFNDTLFTPQPEPAYKLIFNRPSDFNDLKKYAHLIIVAAKRNDSNSGFRLIKKLLPEPQSYNSKMSLFAKSGCKINGESENSLGPSPLDPKEVISSRVLESKKETILLLAYSSIIIVIESVTYKPEGAITKSPMLLWIVLSSKIPLPNGS